MIKEITIQSKGNTMKEWPDGFIRSCLKHTKGIIRLATARGESLYGPIGPLGSFRESIADKYNHNNRGHSD